MRHHLRSSKERAMHKECLNLNKTYGNKWTNIDQGKHIKVQTPILVRPPLAPSDTSVLISFATELSEQLLFRLVPLSGFRRAISRTGGRPLQKGDLTPNGLKLSWPPHGQPLRHITSHHITSHHMTSHHITVLVVPLALTMRSHSTHTVHYITSHHIALQYSDYSAVQYITLRYMTSPYITTRHMTY